MRPSDSHPVLLDYRCLVSQLSDPALVSDDDLDRLVADGGQLGPLWATVQVKSKVVAPL